jgi:hypothetical protein
MRQWQLAVACTLGAVLLAWQLHGLAIAARPRANPQASAWRPLGDGVVEVARDTPDAVATTLTPTQSSQSRFSASTMLPPAAKGGTVGGPIASPALPLPGSEPQQYVARDVLLSDAAGTHVIVQCPIRKVFRNASDNHPLTLLYRCGVQCDTLWPCGYGRVYGLQPSTRCDARYLGRFRLLVCSFEGSGNTFFRFVSRTLPCTQLVSLSVQGY